MWFGDGTNDAPGDMVPASQRKKFGPVFIPLLPAADDEMVYIAKWETESGISADWQAFNAYQSYLIGTEMRTMKEKRSGLGIHGGPLLDDHLRSTYGCVRLFDDDAIAVAKWRERQGGTIYLISRGMI